MIKEFRGEFDFLSNFYRSPITLGGTVYPTAENAFQSRKAIKKTERWRFSVCTPQEAKAFGRSIELREDWDQVRITEMEKVIHRKFKQNSYLRDSLLATGNDILCEGNTWHDQFWGSCYCDRHKDTPGVNALGVILMNERLRHQWEIQV